MVKSWQQYEDDKTGFKVTDEWLEETGAWCFGTYAVPHSVEWERGCRICRKELLRICRKATKNYWHKYLTDEDFEYFFGYYDPGDERREIDVAGRRQRKIFRDFETRVRKQHTVHERS